MRFISILLLSGTFSLFFAVAQQQNPPEAQPAVKKQSSAPASKMMEGMLVSVDQTKQTFVVKLRGSEYTFMANGNTEIIVAGAKKTFADLSAGEAVRVNYMKDGKGNRVATNISQNPSGAKRAQSNADKPAERAKQVTAQPAATQPAATQPAATQPAATTTPVAPKPVEAKPAPGAQPIVPVQQAPAAVQPAKPAPATDPAPAEKK